MKIPLISLVLLPALTQVLAAGSPADNQIRIWESKQIDPEDPSLPCNLGSAYLQKARESGEFAYFVKAEQAFQKSLSIQPEYFPALAAISSAYNSQHKFSAALEYSDKALKIRPNDPFTLGMRGDALLEIGEVDQARKVYQHMLKQAPVLFSYTRMANLQIIEGNTDGALESFDAALQNSAGMPAESVAWCHVQIGGIYFGRGDFAHARKCYQTALEIMPEYHMAIEHQAELDGAEGNFEAATHAYQNLIQRLPRPDLLQALGDLYVWRSMPAEAKPYHARALQAFLKAAADGNAHYYHHLASFYCDVEDLPKEALKWARKDMEIRHNIFAHDTLAWALFKNGEFARAVEEIKLALALNTKDAHMYFHAAMIYSASGDFQKGREYMAELKVINPQFAKFHVHR